MRAQVVCGVDIVSSLHAAESVHQVRRQAQHCERLRKRSLYLRVLLKLVKKQSNPDAPQADTSCAGDLAHSDQTLLFLLR